MARESRIKAFCFWQVAFYPIDLTEVGECAAKTSLVAVLPEHIERLLEAAFGSGGSPCLAK